MKIDILSLFPKMFDGFLKTSIIKRAIDKEVVDIQIHNFREFTHDKHKHVDDYPYGGVTSPHPVLSARVHPPGHRAPLPANRQLPRCRKRSRSPRSRALIL